MSLRYSSIIHMIVYMNLGFIFEARLLDTVAEERSAGAINHDDDMHEMLSYQLSRELQCSAAPT
jgi:hypothetical protein